VEAEVDGFSETEAETDDFGGFDFTFPCGILIGLTGPELFVFVIFLSDILEEVEPEADGFPETEAETDGFGGIDFSCGILIELKGPEREPFEFLSDRLSEVDAEVFDFDFLEVVLKFWLRLLDNWADRFDEFLEVGWPGASASASLSLSLSFTTEIEFSLDDKLVEDWEDLGVGAPAPVLFIKDDDFDFWSFNEIGTVIGDGMSVSASLSVSPSLPSGRIFEIEAEADGLDFLEEEW